MAAPKKLAAKPGHRNKIDFSQKLSKQKTPDFHPGFFFKVCYLNLIAVHDSKNIQDMNEHGNKATIEHESAENRFALGNAIIIML